MTHRATQRTSSHTRSSRSQCAASWGRTRMKVGQVFRTLFLLVLITQTAPAQNPVTSKRRMAKTRIVVIDDLRLTVPSTWKQTKPDRKAFVIRKGQFELPAASQEVPHAVLAVFGGIGGTVRGYVQRWQSEFHPKGRKVSVRRGKCNQGSYIIVDISGSHRLQGKTIPNVRMIAVVLVLAKSRNKYVFKVVGSENTISANAPLIRTLIGGAESKEKDVSLPTIELKENEPTRDDAQSLHRPSACSVCRGTCRKRALSAC